MGKLTDPPLLRFFHPSRIVRAVQPQVICLQEIHRTLRRFDHFPVLVDFRGKGPR
jgi:hypothetical protein